MATPKAFLSSLAVDTRLKLQQYLLIIATEILNEVCGYYYYNNNLKIITIKQL